MHPVIYFTWAETEYAVASYSLFAWIGALVGITLLLPLLKRAGLTWLQSIFFVVAGTAAFLIGARLLNFFVNPGAYGAKLQLNSMHFAGFSLYGGILGVLAMAFTVTRIFRVSPWKVLDTMVFPSGMAFLFARIGCFLNGCCAGKATNSPFGVVFPSNEKTTEILNTLSGLLGKTEKKEIAVYPTQLFEAGLAFLGLLGILVFWRYHKVAAKKQSQIMPGICFLAYSIWFTFMRLLILPLRNLPYPDWIIHIFYPSMYLGLMIAGITAIFYLKKS